MRRGDIVVVALQGDYGKPRPAVVIQADAFLSTHPTILVCPITTELADSILFRIRLEPAAENGLRHMSEVMVDKVQAVRREKVGQSIGHLNEETLVYLGDLIALFIGLTD